MPVGRRLKSYAVSEKPKFARTASIMPSVLFEEELEEDESTLKNATISIDNAVNGAVVRISGEYGDEYVSKNFVAQTSEEVESIVNAFMGNV